MQEKDRAAYLNTIQKNLTESCFDKCGTRKPCLQVCYKKYLAAVNTANDAVRQKGYNALSKLAYKAYPEEQINYLMYGTALFEEGSDKISFAYKGREKV